MARVSRRKPSTGWCDGREATNTEEKLRESLLCQVGPFCQECEEGLGGLGRDMPAGVRLRYQAVRFAVTFIQGLHEFVVKTSVRASQDCLQIEAQLRAPLDGEVATRSKVPVAFQVAKSCRVGFTIAERDGAIRCETEPGSLFSVPVEGAVEAGNLFFGELSASSEGIGEPTVSDAERVSNLALEWWNGQGRWQGKRAGGEQFAGTKLDMIYMGLAGSRAGGAIPRSDLAKLLLGSMCVTRTELAVFEFTVGGDGDILIACDRDPVQDGDGGLRDHYGQWRTSLAQKIQECTITRPAVRKIAEKFAASATNFVIMCSGKGLGLRPAKSDLVIRLFSLCRCPMPASKWDMLAQEWQKTNDTTYSCSGDKEGRVVWRASAVGVDSDSQESSTAQRDSLFCGAFDCCKPRPREPLDTVSPTSPVSLGGRSFRSFDSLPTEGSLRPQTPLLRPKPLQLQATLPPLAQHGSRKLLLTIPRLGRRKPAGLPEALPEDTTLESVSLEEQAAAADLRRLLERSQELAQAAEQHRGGESLDALCLRFSRARPNSASEAFVMLKADLAYRDDAAASSLPTSSAANVLARGIKLGSRSSHSVPPEHRAADLAACYSRPGSFDPVDQEALLVAYCRKMPHAILGRDWQGRPILYRGYNPGSSFSELFKPGLDMDALVRYNQWLLEQCLEIMGQRGQWTVVMDLKGVGFRAIDWSGLQYTRLLMNQGAEHYPERLGRAFVINTPGFVNFLWRRVNRWVDVRTRENVTLHGEADEWRGPLGEVMDLTLLPEHLGGQARLTPTGGVETPTDQPEAPDFTGGRASSGKHFKKFTNGQILGTRASQHWAWIPVAVLALAVFLIFLRGPEAILAALGVAAA